MDYTGDQVLERYLYAKELDTFMQEPPGSNLLSSCYGIYLSSLFLRYRAACSTGSRLGHAAFEAMNLLPSGPGVEAQPAAAMTCRSHRLMPSGIVSGFLGRLQAFCVVERSLTSGLPDLEQGQGYSFGYAKCIVEVCNFVPQAGRKPASWFRCPRPDTSRHVVLGLECRQMCSRRKVSDCVQRVLAAR